MALLGRQHLTLFLEVVGIQKRLVYNGKSHLEMDDLGLPPYFRKPPYPMLPLPGEGLQKFHIGISERDWQREREGETDGISGDPIHTYVYIPSGYLT